MNKIAIIGGTGFEDPYLLENPGYIETDTPYGPPSSGFVTGLIGTTEVFILSRHGKQHQVPPSRINNRANIWAIREMGCSQILSTAACGSLREEIGRGHLVFPDQFIDFTRSRAITFFDRFEAGQLQHVSMSEPFSPFLREKLIQTAREMNLKFHPSGTLITIEGPRFSTRAESVMFRSWGADIINMSVAPECILANELGIPYATVAMSTDYDAWKTDEVPVTWEEVLSVFNRNVENVVKLITTTIAGLA